MYFFVISLTFSHIILFVGAALRFIDSPLSAGS